MQKSFNSLPSFYKRFLYNFNSIMAAIIDCMKKGSFECTSIISKAFGEIKQKSCKTLILTLLDFDKFFEVECNASGMDIRGILNLRSP